MQRRRSVLRRKEGKANWAGETLRSEYVVRSNSKKKTIVYDRSHPKKDIFRQKELNRVLPGRIAACGNTRVRLPRRRRENSIQKQEKRTDSHGAGRVRNRVFPKKICREKMKKLQLEGRRENAAGVSLTGVKANNRPGECRRRNYLKKECYNGGTEPPGSPS